MFPVPHRDDQRKTLDWVHHSLPLLKPPDFGTGDRALKWIGEFLSVGRKVSQLGSPSRTPLWSPLEFPRAGPPVAADVLFARNLALVLCLRMA